MINYFLPETGQKQCCSLSRQVYASIADSPRAQVKGWLPFGNIHNITGVFGSDFMFVSPTRIHPKSKMKEQEFMDSVLFF